MHATQEVAALPLLGASREQVAPNTEGLRSEAPRPRCSDCHNDNPDDWHPADFARYAGEVECGDREACIARVRAKADAFLGWLRGERPSWRLTP